MNKRETTRMLIAASQIFCRKDGYQTTAPLKNLLKLGFCELTTSGYFRATTATPLALLYRPDIDNAERLALEGQVSIQGASMNEKMSMTRLVNKGFATRCLFADYEWKPTEKLMDTIKCWREAKESKL